jgi:hypothetical protein
MIVVAAGTAAGTLQLAGYTMIANLAYRTAETGNSDVILALYDLSSITFTIASIPLAVLVAATSGGILRTRAATPVVGWSGVVVAALLLASGGSLMRTGLFSVHGGYGFLSLVLFMLWLLVMSIALTVRAGRDRRTTSRTQDL